jgi:hypothetical protein
MKFKLSFAKLTKITGWAATGIWRHYNPYMCLC